MNDRTELSDLIFDAGEYIPGSDAHDYIDADKAADAILAAGWVSPAECRRREAAVVAAAVLAYKRKHEHQLRNYGGA